MLFQSKLNRLVKRSLRIIAYVFSFCLCLGFCFSFLISDRVARRPVNADTLKRVQIFVICNGKPGIIANEELEKYLQEPACIFTIPINQVEYWNRELAKTVEANSVVSWKLAVEQLTENKQVVNILFSNDDYYIFSWYEVEGRKVIPKYLKIIHMGYGFVALGLSGVIWLLGWWVVRKLYRKFRVE